MLHSNTLQTAHTTHTSRDKVEKLETKKGTMMLVDASAAPAAEMFQVLGLIGLLIWMVALFQSYEKSHTRACNVFLACWLAGQLAFVIFIFSGSDDLPDASASRSAAISAEKKNPCDGELMTECEYFLENFGEKKCK